MRSGLNTIEDMEASLRELPAFRFLALPYYESVGFVDFEEPEDWKKLKKPPRAM